MNKVILMGRLTRDPELRYTNTNSTAVTSFSLAVDRRFVRKGEERQADFFNIVAWSKTAEFCSNYFHKGQRVAVSGRLQTRTWEGDDGRKRYVTEVVAEDVYFADGKRDSYDNNNQGGGQANQSSKPFSKQSKEPSLPDDAFFTEDDDDNDVPF